MYLTALLVLGLTFVAFVSVNRGRHLQFGAAQTALRLLLALPLVLSGLVLHFFRTRMLAAMVPAPFPAHAALVVVTGMLEILGGVGLLLPRYRKAAAVGIALLLIAVFPANIHVAGKVVAGVRMPGIAVRTAMQAVYMVLVLISAYGLPVMSQGSGPE